MGLKERDDLGRFRAGAYRGGPGTPPGPRAHRKLIREAVSEEDRRAIIDKLTEQAKGGDVQASKTVLLYSEKPPSASPVKLPEEHQHIAGWPPDQRVVALNGLLASGAVDSTTHEVLTKAARDEAEIQVLAPIRKVISLLRTGGDLDQVIELLRRVDLPAIEGEHEVVQVEHQPSWLE